MVTVVTDADTKISVTRATKPATSKIPIFEDVIDNINRI